MWINQQQSAGNTETINLNLNKFAIVQEALLASRYLNYDQSYVCIPFV